MSVRSNTQSRPLVSRGLAEFAVVVPIFIGALLIVLDFFASIIMVANGADTQSVGALAVFGVLAAAGFGSCFMRGIGLSIAVSTLGLVLPFAAIPLELTRQGFGAMIYFALLGLAATLFVAVGVGIVALTNLTLNTLGIRKLA